MCSHTGYAAATAVGLRCIPLLAVFCAGLSHADEPAPPLTRERLEALLLLSPAAQVVQATINETAAARPGQGVWQQNNPELQVFGGPRKVPTLGTQTDLGVTLMVPLDVSGARGRRIALADTRTAWATAFAAEALWRLRFEALDLWLQVQGAVARAEVAKQRHELDEKVLQSIETRFRAGVIGEADVALARAVKSEALGRVRLAQGERDRLAFLLLGRLGVPNQPFAFDGAMPLPEALPLPQLLASLSQRPDRIRQQLEQSTFAADQLLQDRMAYPVPRVQGEYIKEADERIARLGITVPLPLFARNQSARAVAQARVVTGGLQQKALDAAINSEVRSAYARWQSALAAYQQMNASQSDLQLAMTLSTRGYELGQIPLGQLLIARREVTNVRESVVQAHLEAARARLALEQATFVQKQDP